jgi:hypothetical protein
MEKSNNIVMGLILIFLVIVVAGGIFLFLENREDSEEDSASGNQEEQMQDSMAADESSELTDMPDESNTTSVSLDDYGVSFFVPNDVEEVDVATVYKQYQSPESCLYLGQASDDQLLIVAYETGQTCVLDEEFSASEAREVASDDENLILDTATKEGRRGDILNLETVDLGNGISLSFFYKQQFAADVQSQVDEVINSYEVELTN